MFKLFQNCILFDSFFYFSTLKQRLYIAKLLLWPLVDLIIHAKLDQMVKLTVTVRGGIIFDPVQNLEVIRQRICMPNLFWSTRISIWNSWSRNFKLLQIVARHDRRHRYSCFHFMFWNTIFIIVEIRTWHCVEGDWSSQSSKPKFNSRRFIRIDIRTKLASVQNSYCDVIKPSTLRLISYVKQKKRHIYSRWNLNRKITKTKSAVHGYGYIWKKTAKL